MVQALSKDSTAIMVSKGKQVVPDMSQETAGPALGRRPPSQGTQEELYLLFWSLRAISTGICSANK
jgi:hypothetical protein